MQARTLLRHITGKRQVALDGPYRSLGHRDGRGLHAARIRKLRRAVDRGKHLAFREELGFQRAGQELDARVAAVHVVLLIFDHAIKRVRDGDAGIQCGCLLCGRLDLHGAVRSSDPFRIDQTVGHEIAADPALYAQGRISEVAGDRIVAVRLGIHKVQLRALLDRNRIGVAIRLDRAAAGSDGGIHDQQGIAAEVRAAADGLAVDLAALVHSGVNDDLAARAERHGLAEGQHGLSGSHGKAASERGRIQPRLSGLGLKLRNGTDFHHGAVTHQQAGAKGTVRQVFNLYIRGVDEQRAALCPQVFDMRCGVQDLKRSVLNLQFRK